MRETPNTTALLIEYGFIDNANDVARLQANLLDYVEAVVRAVANYTNTPYVSPEGEVENTYTVKSGDTLYSIAQRYGITATQLKDYNNLTSNTLQIGQVLRIPTQTTTPPSTGEIIYTVKSGDTLYKIARDYNVTVKELIDLNNLNSTVLSIGQQLRIPSNQPDNEVGTITYTVKSGDSLWKIAQTYGVSVDDLISANNLSSTALQIGDILIIPTSSPTTPPTGENSYITYTVQRGDSLWTIANRYDISVAEIKSANNLTSDTLQIGQQLRIPSNQSYITYTVKSGDTLYSIARTYNTTVNQIRTLNNLTSNVLNIGQQLRIPIS